MRSAIILTTVIAMSLIGGCKKEEAGFNGGTDTGKQPVNKPGNNSNSDLESASASDGIPPNKPVEGSGGPLSIDPIPDQVVNSGENSGAYSEMDQVAIPFKGGEGTLTFKASSDTTNFNFGVNGGVFFWKPGFNLSGKYTNEVGIHNVTVTVTDEGGQSASQSFKVDIRPLKWSAATVENTDDIRMQSDFHVLEQLHPNRAYEHGPSIGGKALNTKTCQAFDGSQSIELIEAPTVTATGKTDQGGTFDHTFSLLFQYDKKDQQKLGIDKMVFVTWVNFVPNPADSISSSVPAKNIPVYFAYARCIDGDNPNDCKKNAVLYKNMGNYFYCSDYLPNGYKVKDLYCNLAKSNGVSAPGC